MVKKINESKVPLIYSYIYMNIKKQMIGYRISGSNLRKVIQRIILLDKGKGIKGIPRRYCYDIIKDLIELGLIEKIGKVGNNPTYHDSNKNISETAERLKGWKISKKLREDKTVNEKLGIALKILDEDPLYRVVKSQCDKQLKQSFW